MVSWTRSQAHDDYKAAVKPRFVQWVVNTLATLPRFQAGRQRHDKTVVVRFATGQRETRGRSVTPS